MECKVENPLARRPGCLLAAQLCCRSPSALFRAASYSVLLGTHRVLSSPLGSSLFGFSILLLLFPLYLNIQVSFGFIWFFFLGKIPCFCQTLAAPRKGARHSIPWACGERWVRDVSGMLLVAWDILWGLLSPGGVSQRGFPCILKPSQRFIPSQALPVG